MRVINLIMSIASSLLSLKKKKKNEPISKLDENLAWAKKVDDYVKTVILFSSNNYENCQHKENILFSSLETHPSTTIHTFLHSARQNGKNPGDWGWIKETAAYAKKYNIGNCTEMAAVGYEYSAANRSSLSVEVFHIVKGDHVFLVLGREQNSDPNDYTTWGPNAVICDPWSHENYPAKDLLEKLKDYKYTIEYPDGSWQKITSAFNPKAQSIGPIATLALSHEKVDENREWGKRIINKFKTYHNPFDSQTPEHKKKFSSIADPIERVSAIHKEKISVIHNYCSKYKKSSRIETFHIENTDHIYLVIDRKKGSDPNDFTTWGPDAVVCDFRNAIFDDDRDQSVYEARHLPVFIGEDYAECIAKNDVYEFLLKPGVLTKVV